MGDDRDKAIRSVQLRSLMIMGPHDMTDTKEMCLVARFVDGRMCSACVHASALI